MVAECRSKVLQNAPLGAFCNTFDLHYALIGLENQFLVFLRVAVLPRFYCTLNIQTPFTPQFFSSLFSSSLFIHFFTLFLLTPFLLTPFLNHFLISFCLSALISSILSSQFFSPLLLTPYLLTPNSFLLSLPTSSLPILFSSPPHSLPPHT